MKLEKPADSGINYVILQTMLHLSKCVCGLCFIYFLKFLSIYTYIFIKAACQ